MATLISRSNMSKGRAIFMFNNLQHFGQASLTTNTDGTMNCSVYVEDTDVSFINTWLTSNGY
jgi:hypothetical protein